MTNKKDVGLIIKFDDKEYSYEEAIFLYKRFFEILSGKMNLKIPENIIKEAFPPSFFNKDKE